MLKPGQFSKTSMKKEAIIFESAQPRLDPGAFKPSILQQLAAERAATSGSIRGALRGGLEGALLGGGMGAMAGIPAGEAGLAVGGLGGAGLGGVGGALTGWDVGGSKARNTYLSNLEEKYLADQAARQGAATGMHGDVSRLIKRLTGAGEAGVQSMRDMAGSASAAGSAGMAKLRALAGKIPQGALPMAGLAAGAGLGAYGLSRAFGGGASKSASLLQKEAVDPAKELYDSMRSVERGRLRPRPRLGKSFQRSSQEEALNRLEKARAAHDLHLRFRQDGLSALDRSLRSSNIEHGVARGSGRNSFSGTLSMVPLTSTPDVASQYSSPRAKKLLDRVMKRYENVPELAGQQGILGRAGGSLGLLRPEKTMDELPTGNLIRRLRRSALSARGVPESARFSAMTSLMQPRTAGSELTGAGKALGLGAGGLGLAALARKLLGKSAPAATQAAAPVAQAAKFNPYIAGLLGAGTLGAGALGLNAMRGRE